MKHEVNNFKIIEPLLKWEQEGDYYYVQLFLRKKDQTTTFGNKNNSARLIKAYCFFSMEQFISKQEEIITLCNTFKCRAGINLNVRNEKEVAYELLENLADRLKSHNYKGINGILNTTNGAVKSRDKFWLIDCDSEFEFKVIEEILNSKDLRPEGNKILAVLPTFSGQHIMTTRFDVMVFKKLLWDKNMVNVEIHKNNPFALFYPSM